MKVICVRDGDRLSALLPIISSGSKATAAANSETPFSGVLAESRDASRVLVDELYGRRLRRVDMWPMEDGSWGLDACAAAASRHRYRSVSRSIGRSPFVPLDEGWDAYRERLDKKVLSEIRRRRKRLEAAGGLVLQIEDRDDDARSLLDEGLRIEASGWKGSEGTAIIARPEALRFYREITEWAEARGSLRLCFLRLGGRALAFDLSFEEGGAHYLLKTSFDPEYRKFGPGILMRHDMIERCFSEGLTRYEFLGHDEAWKHEWAHDFRDQILLRSFSPSPAGRVEHAIHAHAAPLLRRRGATSERSGDRPSLRGRISCARCACRRRRSRRDRSFRAP